MEEPDKKIHPKEEKTMGMSDEGSDEEELHLLPRHTKVVVTGNNRTKTALVGQRGEVKKAVGLGGWHWLTLANGEEIRLQRNALSVVEHPTPEELLDNKAQEAREAAAAAAAAAATASRHRDGNGAYPSLGQRSSSLSGHPKRAQRQPSSLVLQHPRKSVVKPVSAGKCTLHMTTINFSKLDSIALQKYRRHYKLVLGPSPTKEQLVRAVRAHFSGQTVDENHVLIGFILALHGLSIPRR